MKIEIKRVNIDTYNQIKVLDKTSGVYVGHYAYLLNGELVEGYVYLLNYENKFIPIVKYECTDGIVYATDPKVKLK